MEKENTWDDFEKWFLTVFGVVVLIIAVVLILYGPCQAPRNTMNFAGVAGPLSDASERPGGYIGKICYTAEDGRLVILYVVQGASTNDPWAVRQETRKVIHDLRLPEPRSVELGTWPPRLIGKIPPDLHPQEAEDAIE